MSLYITHLAAQSGTGRRSALQLRAAQLTLGMPPLNIADIVTDLDDKLPKGYFLVNSMSTIVKKVVDKGLSVDSHNKVVELLPDIALPMEANNLPSKPDPYHGDTNAFLTSIMSTDGMLEALNRMQIYISVKEMKDIFKTNGAFDKFIQCFDCIADSIKLINSTSDTLNNESPVYRMLQPLFEEENGLHNLGKLLSMLGIEQTGFIKTDLDSLASPTAKQALMLMRSGVYRIINSFEADVNVLKYSLSDHVNKMENLKKTLKEIKSLLPTLRVLDKTVSEWNGTHTKVVQALSS